MDQKWLEIPEPSEEFKTRVVSSFSKVFADLLLQQTPSDIDYRRSDVRTATPDKRFRRVSLSSHDFATRNAMISAAGASKNDVIEATREDIAQRVAKNTSAAFIIKSLGAQDKFDRFFDQI